MTEKKHTPEMAAKIEAGRARRDAFIAATGIDFKAVADAGFDANSGKPNLSDNAELVNFQHGGLHFSALVDLLPDEQEVAVFYEDGDVTELLKLFAPEHRYAINRLAVVAAMKQRADQAEEDKRSDASE